MQPSRREYEPKPVKVADIILDPECQPRVSIDTAIVEEYAERLQHGAIFENIEVYQDGKKFWCADGFHRDAGRLDHEGPGRILRDLEMSLAPQQANPTFGGGELHIDRAVRIQGDE